jgi:ketosteroid isomerase-like protein
MSQENVEVVRSFYDAVNQRDLRVLDALLASEESEFASVFAVSEGRVFRGTQGVRDYFAAIDEAFENFRTEVLGLLDAGDDRVVAMTRVTGRGRGSGIPVDKHLGQVWTLRGEAVVRIDTYVNPPEALDAAGLRE